MGSQFRTAALASPARRHHRLVRSDLRRAPWIRLWGGGQGSNWRARWRASHNVSPLRLAFFLSWTGGRVLIVFVILFSEHEALEQIHLKRERTMRFTFFDTVAFSSFVLFVP